MAGHDRRSLASTTSSATVPIPVPARPSWVSVGVLAATLLLLAVAGPGAAQSPPGSAGAKAAAKCQQTIAKVNAKFVAQRLKRLATCSDAVLACVQAQPGVEKCVTKATAKCRTQLGVPEVPDAAAAKLEAAVVKACGALPVADLLAAGGLGFADASAACAAVDVAPVAGVADVARCLQRLHAGLSEEAYGSALPRAAELTSQGDVSALVVPDLPVFNNGCGDCGIDPPALGRSVAACGAAIAKAGGKFLAKTRAGLDKCAAALVACAQTKPGDAGCVTKAKATCQKLPTDLATGRTALVSGLAKKCAGTLAFATLDAPAGINLGALACECQQVGVAPVATLDDYALCLTRQHECRLAALVPTVVPSLDGLLADQGLGVNDLLCPPPVSAVAFAGAEPRALRGVFGGISKFVKKVFPGSLKASASPFATRGTARRVGRPVFGGCSAAPGRSCVWRFPISKKPASLTKARAEAALPPTLIIGAQRADGAATDDHFEVELGDTTSDSEVEVEITFADDLDPCNFDLALSVMEDGEVSTYTTVEQTPHVIPDNDSCDGARIVGPDAFIEVLDLTAATANDGEAGATCSPNGVGRNVWYQFTAPVNGMVTVDTAGSDFDSEISLWTAPCSERGFRGCTDDHAGAAQARLEFAAEQGRTYLIEVGEKLPSAPVSTLHFQFEFRPNTPPTVSKLKATLLELNPGTARCLNNGSVFELSFGYSDPEGDVLSSATTALFSAVFLPSHTQAQGEVARALLTLTGDGFSGTGSFLLCTFFGSNTSAETTLQLRDPGGLGPAGTVTINRPPGAN